MMKEFVLGIDLGTTYFKLGLFDRSGRLCGLGRVPVIKYCGDGSLCELSLDNFWSALQSGIDQACEQARAEPENIKALSYGSQANSFILLDKNNDPLTSLILWPDNRAPRRAHGMVSSLRSGMACYLGNARGG